MAAGAGAPRAELPCPAAGASCPPSAPLFPCAGRDDAVVLKAGYGTALPSAWPSLGNGMGSISPSPPPLLSFLPCLRPSPPIWSSSRGDTLAQWDKGQWEYLGDPAGSHHSVPMAEVQHPCSSLGMALRWLRQSEPLGMLNGGGGSCPFSLPCNLANLPWSWRSVTVSFSPVVCLGWNLCNHGAMPGSG